MACRKLVGPLVLALLVSDLFVGAAIANGEGDPQTSIIHIIDNSGIVSEVTIADLDGKVLMGIDDLARYSRCQVTADGDSYSLKHAGGLVTLNVNAVTGEVTDNNAGGTQSIVVALVNGTLFVDAYPILAYFGARYAVDQTHGLLGIIMPRVTFWEALDDWAQNSGTLTNAIQAPSGKTLGIIDNSEASAFLDQLLMMAYKLTLQPSDAMYSAMEQDVGQYSLVQSSRQSGMASANGALELLSAVISTGADAMKVKELIDLSPLSSLFVTSFVGLSKTSDLESAVQAFDTASQASASYAEAVGSIGDALDATLLGVDTIITSTQRFNIDQDVKLAFANTFSSSTVSMSGVSNIDGRYLEAARSVTGSIFSQQDVTMATALDKSIDFVAGKVLDEGITKIVGGGLPAISVELGLDLAKLVAISPVGRYTPFAVPYKAEAELKCIYSAAYYQIAKSILLGLSNRAESEGWKNSTTDQAVHDSYITMLRFMLLNYQSCIEYMSYGNYGSESDYYQQVSEEVAKYIDDAESSTLTTLSSLSDTTANDVEFSNQVLNMPEYSASQTVGGAYSIDGQAYRVFDIGITGWDNAEAYCESVDSHLAVISSQSQNDELYQYVQGCGFQSAYFGLTNTSGSWAWVTGQPVDYLNWHSGEPNNEGGVENYGMFYWKYSDGTWNDGDFGNQTVGGGTAFICQWDDNPESGSGSADQNNGRQCPFEEPLTPAQLVYAGASCAWGYSQYCDCV